MFFVCLLKSVQRVNYAFPMQTLKWGKTLSESNKNETLKYAQIQYFSFLKKATFPVSIYYLPPAPLQKMTPLESH